MESFDMSGREGEGGALTRREELVLKADIKRRVGVRRERHPRLPHDILRSPILVTDGILDLGRSNET